MKKNLLFFFIFLIASIGFAQDRCEDDCDGEYGSSYSYNNTVKIVPTKKIDVLVYPNPAVDFVSFKNAQNVDHILVYNITGQVKKRFAYAADERYNLAELPQGIYLIQFRDENEKIIATKRLKKLDLRS